jgi:hypothetical protein
LRPFLSLHRFGATPVVLGYSSGFQAYMYLQNVANCAADGMPKTCSRIGAAIAATIAPALLQLGSASLLSIAVDRDGLYIEPASGRARG